MIIIGIDPGLVSGYARFNFTPEGLSLEESSELPWNELGEMLDKRLPENPAETAVAIERFTITLATAKKSQAPWSLECIGMTQWLCYQHHVADFVLQNVNEAKNTFSNERLKHLDYWHRGGEGHARDAIRHSLLYALNHGWRDARLLT